MSRKDFHGGRAYAADTSGPSGPGFAFGVSLGIAWLKLQIGRLLRPGVS